MDEVYRNHEISELLDIWEWCSRRLHTKWTMRRKSRNSFLMAVAYVVSQPKPVSPFEFAKTYSKYPHPFLDKRKVQALWDTQPIALLDACLGAFGTCRLFKAGLADIRRQFMSNPELDKLAKTMRAREKRFGPNWPVEGHHPVQEFAKLKKGTVALRSKLRMYLVKNHGAISELALEILSQGGWQFGELRASSLVRKTPESLLNRATRLKLWDAAHEVLGHFNGDRDEAIEKLSLALDRKITPSVRSSIESQGFSVNDVVDDWLNFDLYKSRVEIVS